MATKAIPAGTANFSTNLPVELRREAGRLAYTEGRALGALIREHLADRVRIARKRGVLDAPGQLLLRFGCVALMAIGIGAVVAASVRGSDDTLLARRMNRRREEVCVAKEWIQMGGGA
jgi:hypothetical protein